MRTNTCLLRLSQEEHTQLDFKSKLLGTTKSQLLRDGALSYWSNDLNPEKLLNLYQESDNETKQLLVSVIAEYYRKQGYPHNKLTSSQLLKEMTSLFNTKNPLLDNNHLQMNTTGLRLANHFHPHMVRVKCLTNYRSPYEQFEDDDLFRDAIDRWMKLGKKPNPSGLRRILRTRDGVRSVVNFKPAIAKYFYDVYVPEGGRVLDPCSGYSGRLSGCISSNRGISYHGIDPDGRTATGNMKMAGFFINDWKFGFSFDLGCAEDIMPKLVESSYDLVFSSPPYFDVEKYSLSSSQSYLRYPEYGLWRDNFLRKILIESVRVVKGDGHVIFNVKNYKKCPIADDLCGIMEELGFVLKKKYEMRLANSEFHRRDGEITWHTEPIFVFSRS